MVLTSRIEMYHRIAYVILSLLCAMMVGWILGLPGSWRAGWKWHDDLINVWYNRTLKRAGNFPTPLNLVTKYKGHTVAQLCHILPGALWAGIIPFQLHPSARKKFRRWHRLGGYIFVFVAYLMTVGFIYIDCNALIYMHSDFPGIPPYEHTTWLPVHVPHEPVFRVVGGWFAFTISIAAYYATQKKFETHRRWILRHVGAGIWIAVQRLVVIIVNAKTPEGQKKTFGDGAFLGVLLTSAAAEVAVWGYETKKRIKRKYI